MLCLPLLKNTQKKLLLLDHFPTDRGKQKATNLGGRHPATCPRNVDKLAGQYVNIPLVGGFSPTHLKNMQPLKRDHETPFGFRLTRLTIFETTLVLLTVGCIPKGYPATTICRLCGVTRKL